MIMDIQSFLLANCDDDKAKFDSKLISTKYKIYGVKTNLLEKFAKNLTKTDFSFDNFKFAPTVSPYRKILSLKAMKRF